MQKRLDIKTDYELIYNMIEPNSKVLDLGCGDGSLLLNLVKGKKIQAQGIEINEVFVRKCVEKGLNVFHSDIDSGLFGYPDDSFDYVILNQSMQQTKKVDFVMEESLRVGKKVIVGFPNFAYLWARMRLFFKGKVPITISLPWSWYNTENLHFLSIADFIDYCEVKDVFIEEAFYLGKKGLVKFLPNLFALNALFLIKKKS